MLLREELTSEICVKIGSLDRKMTQNQFQTRIFSIFLENLYLWGKMRKRYFIFCIKNRNTCQFHSFAIKNDFGNMLESGEFRFENSFKKLVQNIHWTKSHIENNRFGIFLTVLYIVYDLLHITQYFLIEGCSQMPTDWSKASLCPFETCFLRKVHENSMRDY